MNELFHNVLTASFHGGIVIAVVLLARLALRKAPKKYICLLWLLAAVRLLMPFEIESGLSLQPDLGEVTVPGADYAQQVVYEGFDSVPQVPPVTITNPDAQTDTTIDPKIKENVVEYRREVSLKVLFLENYELVFAWLWAAVAGGLAAYSAVSYLRLRQRVKDAVILSEGVWICPALDSAFVLGFFRPQIYLNAGLSDEQREFVLAHERCHIRRLDHWWKLLGFVTLAVHWFNPLVWAGYILLCKDLEMACDQAVVKHMDVPQRKAYSAALLSCSTGRRTIAACPVAFGEVSVKDRIKSVLNYRKPKFWIIVASLAAVIVVAVCFLTSPVAEDAEEKGNGLPGWVYEISPGEVEGIVAYGCVTGEESWFYTFSDGEAGQMLKALQNLSGTVATDPDITHDRWIYLYITLRDGSVLQLQSMDNRYIWMNREYYLVDEEWLLSWPQTGNSEIPTGFDMYSGKTPDVAQLSDEEQKWLDMVMMEVNRYLENQENTFHLTLNIENMGRTYDILYDCGAFLMEGDGYHEVYKDGQHFVSYSNGGNQRLQDTYGKTTFGITAVNPETVSEITGSTDENGSTTIVITTRWGQRGQGRAAKNQETYILDANGRLIEYIPRLEWYDESDEVTTWALLNYQFHDTSTQEIRSRIDEVYVELKAKVEAEEAAKAAAEAADWGISVLQADASATGIQLWFVQADDTLEGTLIYGQAYTLERWNGSGWEPVEPIIDNGSFTMEALLLEKNHSTAIDIDWEWLYGALGDGYYRLGKDIWLEREPGGERESQTFYVRFNIGGESVNGTVAEVSPNSNDLLAMCKASYEALCNATSFRVLTHDRTNSQADEEVWVDGNNFYVAISGDEYWDELSCNGEGYIYISEGMAKTDNVPFASGWYTIEQITDQAEEMGWAPALSRSLYVWESYDWEDLKYLSAQNVNGNAELLFRLPILRDGEGISRQLIMTLDPAGNLVSIASCAESDGSRQILWVDEIISLDSEAVSTEIWNMYLQAKNEAGQE